jgi:HEAT repeat protein
MLMAKLDSEYTFKEILKFYNSDETWLYRVIDKIIQSMGPKAIHYIRAEYAEQNNFTKKKLLSVLTHFEENEAFLIIKQQCLSKDIEITPYALRELSNYDYIETDVEIRDFLKENYENDSIDIRAGVAFALGKINESWCEEIILEMLEKKGESSAVYQQIVDALINFEDCEEILISLLEHSSSFIREQALVKLTELKSIIDKDICIKLVNDKARNVRKALATYLGHIKLYEDIVVTLFFDDIRKVWFSAEEALREFQSQKYTTILLNKYDEVDEKNKKRISKAIGFTEDETLGKALMNKYKNEKSATVRYELVNAIRMTTSKEKWMEFTNIIKTDKSKKVRERVDLINS